MLSTAPMALNGPGAGGTGGGRWRVQKATEGQVTEDSADVLQPLDLPGQERAGPNEVTVEVRGETGLMCQSVGAQQINEAMGSIASNVRQTSAALEEFNKATYHLRASIEQLNQEIASFKV